MRRAAHGQTTLEYAIFIAVVAAAAVSMSLYIRRAVQANIKTFETQTRAEPMR